MVLVRPSPYSFLGPILGTKALVARLSLEREIVLAEYRT